MTDGSLNPPKRLYSDNRIARVRGQARSDDNKSGEQEAHRVLKTTASQQSRQRDEPR
jgi:hypothetical protein